MDAAASRTMIRRAIVIAALGYFIDVFDLQTFAVLRVPSLTELGVAPERMAQMGGSILSQQMVGVLLGGLLWGYLGDRFGRLKAMYGSILIYSLATLLCATVHDPAVYGAYRFLAGLGLAGETGAAVTLIAEMMPARSRGWGIMIVGGIGLAGPVGAVCISWLLPWRETYVAAGVFGLLLLILRKTLAEPLMFTRRMDDSVKHGSWALLVNRRSLFVLLCCLAMGAPLIYGFSIMNFFSAEFSTDALRAGEPFVQKYALLAFYSGSVLGDFASGALTQYLGSRRKTIAAFLLWGIVVCVGFLLGAPMLKLSTTQFYAAYFLIGTTVGYWVLMTTVAAEHFGTNIRATTAIVVTNTVRGLTVPLVFILQALKPFEGITLAAAIIGLAVYPVALLALRGLKETHGLDLDYLETA